VREAKKRSFSAVHWGVFKVQVMGMGKKQKKSKRRSKNTVGGLPEEVPSFFQTGRNTSGGKRNAGHQKTAGSYILTRKVQVRKMK